MDIKINKKDTVPIYYQIYLQLKKLIENKTYLPGEKLPSERELEAHLGVSRITIRQAIKYLIIDGHCYIEKGIGVFVLEKKIHINIDALRGVGNFIGSLNLNMETVVVERKTLLSDVKISKKLSVSIKSKIFHLKRLRIIEGLPQIIENTNLSLDRFKGLEKYDFTGSLYRIINEKHNIIPHHSSGTIINRLPNEEEATLLKIPFNSTVVEKEAVVYDKNNIPIEYINSIYNSSKFIFVYNAYSK